MKCHRYLRPRGGRQSSPTRTCKHIEQARGRRHQKQSLSHLHL